MNPEFAADWVALHAELGEVKKNRSADMGTHKYRFADMAAVLADVRPRLSRHNIAQDHEWESMPDGSWRCITVFVHRSGAEYRKPGVSVVMGKKDPQAQGSALSYARRYSLLSALGIATEDDDGRAARPAPATPRQQQRPSQEPTATDPGRSDRPSQAMTAKVSALFREKGITTPEAKHNTMSDALEREVTSWKDLTKAEASRVIDMVAKLPDVDPAEDPVAGVGIEGQQ